jgi:hypothetical protein
VLAILRGRSRSQARLLVNLRFGAQLFVTAVLTESWAEPQVALAWTVGTRMPRGDSWG